jgi:hypothetical protein
MLVLWYRLVPREPGEEREPQPEAGILRHERLRDLVQDPPLAARQAQQGCPVRPARSAHAVSAAPALIAPGVLRAWMLSVGPHGLLPAGIAVVVGRWARQAWAGGLLAGVEAGRPSHGVAFLLGGAAPDAGRPGGQGIGKAPGAYRAPETDGFGGKDLR